MGKFQVEPRWGAAGSFVCYLYAVWVLSNVYPSFEGGNGAGIMLFALLALPIGAVVIIFFGMALSLCFAVIEAPVPRAGILALALIVFLSGYGIPNRYILLIGAALTVVGFISEKRKQEVERRRQEDEKTIWLNSE